MYPFSKIGLTPELGSSYILPRVAGMANEKVLMIGSRQLQAKCTWVRE